MRQMFDLASFIAGSQARLRKRPFVSVITNPISPLSLDAETLKILEFCALQGIPVTCAPAPISGATAPATLAGTLAQLHAEALAGIALVQFLAPGAPVLYGAVASTFDLRTMDLAMGSVEAAMINTGAVALAHRCHLPIYASAGVTDAKLPDVQAGFEKGVSNLLLGMAGADYIHLAAGMIDSGNSIAYEQYIIDNEILGMIERILRGIAVDTETLGLECIERVGPAGSYVLDDHTVQHMFNEFFYPRLAVRGQYDRWTALGSPTPLTKAHTLVKEYLDASEMRLAPETVAAIRRRFPGIVELEPAA
jgi:trimethylamine--corrinoid protein Co-methyltransferase